MVNYLLGKLYKIVCNETGEEYYGSTCQDTVEQRLDAHVKKYKGWVKTGQGAVYTSFQIIARNNFSIVLLETYPCSTRNELTRRERFYIENNECVNFIIPTRSIVEYRIENKNEILSKQKIYRDNNKNEIKERRTEYQANNRQKINLKQNENRAKKKLLKLEDKTLLLELHHNEKT